MLFNSLTFCIFLPLIFIIYWFALGKRLKAQNVLLLVGSYIFYGWWDVRFLSLIFVSSAADFIIGQKIFSAAVPNKKRWLWLSIAINLGLLGFFKYFNFFIDSFIAAFTQLGIPISMHSLHIILPVGISFYTFQTMSYSLDIYRDKLKPTKDPIAFFAFVSFFPQLVAGPIERARDLLPQFEKPRHFKYAAATDGLRQMLWGFFKKILIADNCAPVVNAIFTNFETLPAGSLLLGLILFSVQIYCDFSGYSDIAIGTARLFGIQLNQNFAFPYFSRDMGEFWRRWHISLSTWFRDYVFIPLGGSRAGRLKLIRNIFVVYLISGLWHGASWTFVAWGAFHAILFLPLILAKRNRDHTGPIEVKSIGDIFRMLSTFMLFTISWPLFCLTSIGEAFSYYAAMLDTSIFTFAKHALFPLFIWIFILFTFEWFRKNDSHGLAIEHWKKPIRWVTYFTIAALIFFFGNFTEIAFIYFAF